MTSRYVDRALDSTGLPQRRRSGRKLLSSVPRTQVNLVLCPSFHGATLFSLLLNNHSVVSALGDTVPWRRRDSLCACGSRVSQCDFWTAVATGLDSARYAYTDSLIPTKPWPLIWDVKGYRLLAITNERANDAVMRSFLALARSKVPIASWAASRPFRGFAELYLSFYEVIRELQGTQLVVDGSKSIHKAAALFHYFGADVDLRIIHITRDPRGFAYSWNRHGNGSTLEAASVWRDYHERVRRMSGSVAYLHLCYEDLCLDTRLSTERVFEFLGVENEDVLGQVRDPAKHHLIGNRMLADFRGEITLDKKWTEALGDHEQRAVLSGAGHLALELGYRGGAS